MKFNNQDISKEDFKELIKDYNKALVEDKEYFVFKKKIIYTEYKIKFLNCGLKKQ